MEIEAIVRAGARQQRPTLAGRDRFAVVQPCLDALPIAAAVIGWTGNRRATVKTANATYGCDSVVVAAGPQIPQLMAQLGVSVPVVGAR